MAANKDRNNALRLWNTRLLEPAHDAWGCERPAIGSNWNSVLRRLERNRDVRRGEANFDLHLQAGWRGPVDDYTGTIDQFGVELGGVTAGHLIWGVIAASKGLPAGALAGSYAGVGANASFGVGAGANILVGGTGRAFSLQPLSVQGQTGVNIAGGVTTVTLVDAP
jgi:Protein of unknown function (DUF992)